MIDWNCYTNSLSTGLSLNIEKTFHRKIYLLFFFKPIKANKIKQNKNTNHDILFRSVSPIFNHSKSINIDNYNPSSRCNIKFNPPSMIS